MSGEEERLQHRLAEIEAVYAPEEQEWIEKAYAYAAEAHRGISRLSGEPYLSHCLEVARLLFERRIDWVGICAALLHDVLEDTPTRLEDLKEAFPFPIAELVEGVTKIGGLPERSYRIHSAENLRRLILATARDLRAVLIKFCDRLHNMRTLEYLPVEDRKRISRDTLEIYAPIAHRLGMQRIRAELEDLAMRYLYPAEYGTLAEFVNKKRAERQAFIERVSKFLSDYLEANQVKADIQGRFKHFYSILQKMKRQGLSFDEIYDLFALRVVVERVEDCWSALGLIHKMWHPLPGRVRDHISVPKSNMYQSLHTTVLGLEGEIIEVQIRTWEMHYIAEEGIAAHWSYKERLKPSSAQRELGWLQMANTLLQEVKDPSELLQTVEEDILGETIFCFTPKGEIIDLSEGATPIDFAYRIHTELGNHCQGARVNRRFVPLRHQLQTGDVVEIITGKQAHPSVEWLEFVRTANARQKIRHWLRSTQADTAGERGKEQVLRLLKQHHLPLSLAELEKRLASHLDEWNLAGLDKLFVEVGFGNISAERIVNILKPPREVRRPVAKPRKAPRSAVVVEGLEDVQVKLARCCNPIAGEEIVGFTSAGKGVKIHRQDCANVERLVRLYGAEDSRFLKAHWTKGELPPFEVSLRIHAQDRVGLLRDLSEVISSMGINILQHAATVDTKKGEAVVKLVVAIENNAQLNSLFSRLEGVKEVKSLERLRS